MANLQDQLGLGLAVKQTQQQNNNQNYSFQSTNPLSGATELSVGVQKPFEAQIDLGGGAPFNYGPGGGQDHTMDSIDYNGNKIPSGYATQSFSASSGVSAPQGTTNIGIGDTFSGITPKKDKNIAQSTAQVGTIPPIGGVPTVPVSPTLTFNQQQRLANIAKRQGVAGIPPATGEVTPMSPSASATGLQGAELQAYNQLTPQEQKTFNALATQGIKAQTDYLAQSKAAQEYNQAQEDIFQQSEDIRDQAEDIQSRQQLEAAAKQVANLKQNIGYIGTGGQPGVSSAKLDAVGQQVALANKTYDDVVKIDQLNKANRKLGQDSHALQFTRQMTQLQDDLDSKVNKQIQGALNQFNAAELKGKLDTIPEIEAFQQQLYAQLDGDLSSIMDTNIEARKFLIERYDKLAESQKTQMANKEKAQAEELKKKNTLNKDMSNALGYYVNDLGEPLVDQKTGQRIVVPPESDITYDKDSGQAVIITKNRDGTMGVQLKQVGTGKPEDAPKTIQVDNPDGTKSTMQWTGSQWSPIQAPIGSNVTPQEVSPQSIVSMSSRLQGNNVQCGMVTNDYTKQKFPNAPRMGDTYESKVNVVNSIGVSPTPQVGGVFAMNTGTSTGHTGIVQSVDIQNGTFTATDANAEGSPNGGPVKTSTYSIGPKTTFSVAPQVTGAQTGTGSLSTLATFMKDNQDRGQGYSNDDVKAFNEKIDRMAKSGDDKGMAIAYRNMVMKDKDFKKDFDDTQKFSTALDTVKKMVSDYEKAGKDTNALKKVAETVGRKLGLTTDTALAQLQTQMGVTMANYIKSISGTAASDAEVQRLMGNMANIGNVEELNTAIISTVKDNAMNGLKSMIDTRMYGMPEELKPQVFGDIYKEEAKAVQAQKTAGVKTLGDFQKSMQDMQAQILATLMQKK